MPSFNFSLVSVSGLEVQSFSIFPTWLSHHVTYDVILIIKSFYMRSRSDGEKFASNQQEVVAEKTTKVLCGQTNKPTDPNAMHFPLVRLKM